MELTHIEEIYGTTAKVMAKLENFNPAGSVKERIAKAALDHSLEPDWTITLRTEEEKKPC